MTGNFFMPVTLGNMPSENFLLIKEAVEKKQQIQATYGGYFREMSPHVL